MTYRQSDSSSKDGYSKPQSRLNQQIRCDSTDEGCPVMEESGTVCGETNSLGIFQEFRQMYDECLKKLKGSPDGSATLRKLAPFKKLIDDLWEQNTMLVETVEELEQEATCRVTDLQDRLNKSCQKMCEYKEDIESLVMIIQSFCENGMFDPTGLKFKTLCPASVFGTFKKSGSTVCHIKEREPEISFRKKSAYEKNSTPQSNFTIKKKSDACLSDLTSETIFAHELSSLKKNFNNKNCLKHFSVEDVSDSFSESLCLDNSCSFKSSKQSSKFEKMASEESDYLECMRPININFNIDRNAVLDTTDCCCECPCTINIKEFKDC